MKSFKPKLYSSVPQKNTEEVRILIEKQSEIKFGAELRSLRRQTEGLSQAEKLLEFLNTGTRKVKSIDRANFDDGKREIWITYTQQPSEKQLRYFKSAKPQEKTIRIVEGEGKKKVAGLEINQAEIFDALISLSELHRDYQGKKQEYESSQRMTAIYTEIFGAINHSHIKLQEKEEQKKKYVETFLQEQKNEYEERHPIRTAVVRFFNAFSVERAAARVHREIDHLYDWYYLLTNRKYEIVYNSPGKAVRRPNADEIEEEQKGILDRIKELSGELMQLKRA